MSGSDLQTLHSRTQQLPIGKSGHHISDFLTSLSSCFFLQTVGGSELSSFTAYSVEISAVNSQGEGDAAVVVVLTGEAGKIYIT